MDFTASLKAKQFFRFTGPPENWLTAIKYMTWGLEEKHRKHWENIQPGDIFLIHSTGAQTSKFKNAKSGIIGIGVVGGSFTVKTGPLWIQEIEEHTNQWPLLVPFSEIYLFSEVRDPATWQSPTLSNLKSTKELIAALLQNFIPLSQIKGFPPMGSFSTVKYEVVEQILNLARPLYVYSSENTESVYTSKPTELTQIRNVSESLRYSESLKFVDNIKTKIVAQVTKTYTKDNELLARAESVHGSILQSLIEIFRKNGYETFSNKFVDLFAHNGKRSFLIDVKSIENNNFRSQARKGIVQLYEYDYFEIQRFVKEKALDFSNKYKLLVPSQVPKDEGYVGFVNSMDIGLAIIENDSLKPVGKDSGFSKF